MRVVLSQQAQSGITRIGDYIAQDNPHRALQFTRELRAKSREIGDLPFGFPLIPGHEVHGIRRRPYRDYLIFYRVEEDRIMIVAVLHGAQNYEALLFPPA